MRLHSIDVGDGESTALLLHGMGGSAESWAPVTDHLLAEVRAAERFDPESAASVSCGPAQRWEIAPGSIMIRASPSQWVGEGDTLMLRERGVSVRDIDGAAHTVWYSHLDEFIRVLPEVFPQP